jgi:hypothetical protein
VQATCQASHAVDHRSVNSDSILSATESKSSSALAIIADRIRKNPELAIG